MSFAPPDADITYLIEEWRSGDRSAENRLFESVYQVLHECARQCLRLEDQARSLDPTLLVHEAYLPLANSPRIEVNGREHFVRLARCVMKHVDRARKRRAVRHGGAVERAEWNEQVRAICRMRNNT